MKIAVSWSGGMESALACHKVLKQGHDVAYLVVFVAETWPAFCHPIPIMELQAKALGIPLLKLRVQEPYEKSYNEAISKLVEMDIEGIFDPLLLLETGTGQIHGGVTDRAERGDCR